MKSILALSVETIAFIGLSLLGWGIFNIDGFFHHPARLLYCVITVLLQVVGVIVSPRDGKSPGEGIMPVQRQRAVRRVVRFLCAAILVVAPLCDRRSLATLPNSDLCRYIGLALFAIGSLLVIWTTVCLGRQLSFEVTIQKGHKLITDGAYRFVRHPRYLATLIWITGLALVFRSWLALGLVAPLALMLVWRMHDEETLLRNQFQSDWDAYAQRTFRLIPFVY